MVVGGSASRDDVPEYSPEQFTECGKVQRYQQPSAGAHEGVSSVRARILRAIGRALETGPERYTNESWRKQKRGQPENKGRWVKTESSSLGDSGGNSATSEKHQKLTQTAETIVADSLRELSSTDPRLARLYAKKMNEVFETFTERSLEIVTTKLAGLHFYKKHSHLARAILKYDPQANTRAVAFLAPDNTIHVNGGKETSQNSSPMIEIYAHEFYHLIDRHLPKVENSSSKRWYGLWMSEILKNPGLFGDQARSSALEGWAYFGEVMTSRRHEVQEFLPRSIKYWQSIGLLK